VAESNLDMNPWIDPPPTSEPPAEAELSTSQQRETAAQKIMDLLKSGPGDPPAPDAF
jgi:hypothetical protein